MECKFINDLKYKIDELPDIFWQRLFIIILAYTGAQIALYLIQVPLPVDNSLLLSVYAILLLIVMFFLPKILANPFFNYISVQLIFFCIVLDDFLRRILHISVKPHAFVFGLAILAGIIYFFKNFNFLWRFTAFKFLFIFFVINIIYYFCHYSTFNINLINLSGNIGAPESQNAKTIILIGNLAIFLSSVISLSLFTNITKKIELDILIYKISKILSYCFILVILFLSFINIGRIHGGQVYLSIYFLLLLGFKYYIDNMEISNKFLSNSMTVTLTALFGFIISSCNKSSMVAILAATFFLVFVNYRLKLKFNIVKNIKNKNFKIIFSVLFISLLIFIIIKFDIPAMIQTKLEKTFSSFFEVGINSYSIRTSNWSLFQNYWINHLDVFSCLFGFGIGKSREVIYYITQSQYSPIYLVQTTHNQYMEMFFDYGAVALLYFTPLIFIFFRNILIIIKPGINSNIKIISTLGCSLIVFYFIYHYSDGLRIPTAIIFFSALMLLEGIIKTMQEKLC